MSRELVISFLFPPSDYVSGIMLSKRILENKKNVDVLQVKDKNKLKKFNSIIDEYIDERIILDMPCRDDSLKCIFKFISEGLGNIKKDYAKIYSISWYMANHYLAFEYKLQHPEVFWSAEFSDPLFLTMKNNYKSSPQMEITDETFIGKINSKIREFNQKNNTAFPEIENPSSAYFIAEYITYLFADEIIFTNANQKQIMLERCPIDIRDFVLDKSVIKHYPTLPESFYYIEDAELNLDEDCINIAYFGSEYYGLRHFEGLFYALGSLNHKFLEKIRVYLFINNRSLLKTLTRDFDNILIKKPLSYLEFLNATTKFDVLLVNDANTKEYFEMNPYLPSKLSDYLGCGNDIWSLYEEESCLCEIDVKYKSCINDYPGIRQTLIEILKDNGYDDSDSSFNENYLARRFTELNEILEKENLRKNKFKKQLKDLEKENRNSKNSKKLSKLFKKLK